MAVLTLQIPKEGRLVLLTWAMMIGTTLAALFSSISWQLGLVIFGVLCGFACFLWWYSGQVKLFLHLPPTGAAQISIQSGWLIRHCTILPCANICSYAEYTGLLLRRARCAIVVCHTLGHSTVLPPLRCDTLALLTSFFVNDAPPHSILPDQSEVDTSDAFGKSNASGKSGKVGDPAQHVASATPHTAPWWHA